MDQDKEKELAAQIKNLTELITAKYSSADTKAAEAEKTALVETVHALQKRLDAIEKLKAVQKMVYATGDQKAGENERLLTFGGFLKGVATKDGDVLAAITKTGNGQSINVNADGGYAVPVEYSTEIIKLLRIFGVARQVARLVPMNSLTRKVNVQLTHPTATYTDEAVAHTKTKVTLDTPITQTAKKLSAVIPITEELLEENNIGMDSVIYEAVANAFARVEDDQAFAGTGSPFTGVLSASGLVTATQNGATPSYDDLVDTMMGIAASYRRNGSWVIDSTGLKLVMKIVDANGLPIWTSPIGGNPGTILGKPYRETESFTSKMIFGDFSYLWLSDRTAYEVKASTEASDASGGSGSAFLQDEVWYKFRQRHSINVMKGSAFSTMTLASA
jgi:HK97 family phage major capsid protein